MGSGAFTRRGILRIAGGLGLSSAAQAAKPAFTALSGANVGGAVAEAPLEGDMAWYKVDRLLSLQNLHRQSGHAQWQDHDIVAMKSWAPWARALKQRQREFEHMGAINKIKAKYGITW